MPSNNVFQYSKIRRRKRSAKKSIKTGKKNGIQLFLESGIHCAGIRNPVPGIRNPQHGIQNPRLSWIPLHGANRRRNLTSVTLVPSAKQRRYPCCGPPTGSTNYRKRTGRAFRIFFHLDWQIDKKKIKPIMALSQILVH